MPAKDLGVKHTCWKCGTKFYDLKKPNPVCPKCGANPRDAPTTKPTPAAERRRAKEEPVEEVAAELGVSEGAVYVATCRVLRRLREELAGVVAGAA
jgi:uncharacterized protein (TIGR02300 family)